MSESHTSRPFGQLPGGEGVETHILRGAGGLSLGVLTYGGIVTQLHAPDRRGEVRDVVLGFDRLEGYLAEHPYFGAIAGRVAGRITRGRFTLDGRTYPVTCNDPPNHLHGGVRGFDKRLWSATPSTGKDGAVSLRLSRLSPDGEEGYPGNVSVAVTYTVTAGNEFVFDVEATADAATPFSLTHHSYFNLSGEGSGSTEGHDLQIFAGTYAPADESMGLIGRREPVGTNDLRQPRRLGDVIPHLHSQHGDLYFVDRPAGSPPRSLVSAARLHDEKSGRVLTVSTTDDCLQLYTGTGLDGTLVGKAGQKYGPFAGLCLESEWYPDAVNVPTLGDMILRPGRTARQTTVYAFATD